MGAHEARQCPGIVTCQNAALKLPLRVSSPARVGNTASTSTFVGKAVEAVSGKNLNVYLARQPVPADRREGHSAS